jgi:hypothetical protein
LFIPDPDPDFLPIPGTKRHRIADPDPQHWWSGATVLTWSRLDVVAGKDAVAYPDPDFLPIPDPGSGSATLIWKPPPAVISGATVLTWSRLDVVAGKDAVADPDPDFLPIPDPGSATLIWKPPPAVISGATVLTWSRLDVVAGEDAGATVHLTAPPVGLLAWHHHHRLASLHQQQHSLKGTGSPDGFAFCASTTVSPACTSNIYLKLHKIENCFGFNFDFFTISLLVMLKY